MEFGSHKNYQKGFKENIYFARFARIDSPQEKYPSIEIFNDKIYLPETYAYQYIFAKLDVGKEYLTIYVEIDTKPQIIHEQKFPVRFTKSKLSKSAYIPNFIPAAITQSVPVFN